MRLIFVLALLLSSNAYASKARLASLGEESRYSIWIEDDRNIFLNAANVNQYKDFAIVEFGASGNALSLDLDEEPKAQGGFLTAIDGMVAGVYLGNESNTTSLLKVASDAGLSQTDNVLDLFLASTFQSGLEWGANFLYSRSSEEVDESGNTQKDENDASALRLGVKSSTWQAFTNISLSNQSEDAQQEAKFDGKLGYHVGGSLDLNKNWKVFAQTIGIKWDQIKEDVTTKANSYEYYAGVGYSKNVSEKIRLYTNITFESQTVDIEFAQNPTSIERLRLPLTIAFEAKSYSWLTLRGAIKQNLYGQENNRNFSSLNATARALAEAEYGDQGKRTAPNSTDVSAGATFHVGDLSIDGLIGTSAFGRGDGNDVNEEDGILTGDNILSRVSLHYRF